MNRYFYCSILFFNCILYADLYSIYDEDEYYEMYDDNLKFNTTAEYDKTDKFIFFQGKSLMKSNFTEEYSKSPIRDKIDVGNSSQARNYQQNQSEDVANVSYSDLNNNNLNKSNTQPSNEDEDSYYLAYTDDLDNEEIDFVNCEQYCGLCEVCVNYECHPYVMKKIYHLDDTGNQCKVVDYCQDLNSTCSEGVCRPVYGSYICDCSTHENLYNKCSNKPTKKRPGGKVLVLYPAMVRAGSIQDHVNPERAIMVSIQLDSPPTNFSLSIEYTVFQSAFSDYRQFSGSELNIDSSPIKSCTDLIGDELSCRKYYKNDTENRYSLFFTPMFPMIGNATKNNETNGLNIVSTELPNGAKVFGYEIQFSINVVSRPSNHESKSSHSIFVYKLERKRNECFPLSIMPSLPCANFFELETIDKEKTEKKIREKKTIVVSVFLGSGKASECDYEFKFYIEGLTNSYQEEFTSDSASSSGTLSLEAFDLEIDRYRVVVKVSLDENPEVNNFAVCFFNVVKGPLKAAITGGASRIVYAYEDLIMDASESEDPNNPPGIQTNLLFTWSCNQPDEFCHEHKTKARKYKIKSPLRPKVTFDFLLEVSAFDQSKVSCRQRVITTDIKFASFSIICRKNCGDLSYGSDPNKIIYLEALIPGKQFLENVEFIWNYNMIGRSTMPLRPIDEIKVITSASNICIIQASTLLAGKYTFSAFRTVTKGNASYSITVGASPAVNGKSCSAEADLSVPTNPERFILFPRYRITCSIHHESLNYTFFYMESHSNTIPIYFNNSESPIAYPVYNFRDYSGKGGGNLFVLAKHPTGSYTKHQVLFKSKYSTYHKHDLPSMVQDKKLIEVWFFARFSYLMTPTAQNYEVVEHLNIIEFITRKRHFGLFKSTSVWFYIIQLSSMLKFHNTYDFISLLSPLTRLIENIGIPSVESETTALQIGEMLILKLTKQYMDYEGFFDHDKMLTSEEFRVVSKSLFECLSALIDSLYLRVDNSVLEFDKKSALKNRRGRKYTFNKDLTTSTSGNIVFKTKLYNHLKTFTSIVERCLIYFLDALAKRILPMESFDDIPGLTICNDNFCVTIINDSPSTIEILGNLPSKHVNHFMSFLNVSASLAKELNDLSPYIEIKIILLDKNPYWWDNDESIISSQLLYAEILTKNSDETWTRVTSTINYLDVFLSVKQTENTTIEGSAVLAPVDGDAIADESSVTVYRVWPPLYGGGGTLIVRFMGLTANDSFRVSLTDGLYPDYAHMMTHAQTVHADSYETFLDYNVKDSNTFLYVGIIPGPLFNTLDTFTSIKFKLEVFIVRCLMRKHSMWLAKYCQVSNEIDTQLRTHCMCKEFSGLMGSAIVAPKVEPEPFMSSQFLRDYETNLFPLIFVCVLLILFVVFLSWALYRDKRNRWKNNVILLSDNFPGEPWPYLVGVYTGTRPWSGTDANVGIQLFGTLSASRTHVLRSSHKHTFNSYSDSWFLLLAPKRLGRITKMHIWMDYAEMGAGWYCRKILVYDFSTKEKYLFRLGCWFFIGLHSDMINLYMAPEVSPKESFKSLLGDNFTYHFQEYHFAVSIFHHHPRSFVTGAEVIVTFWTMVASSAFLLLLFYKYDFSGTEDYPYVNITDTDVLIAFLGNFPSIIISLTVRYMFKSKVLTNKRTVWKAVGDKLKVLEHSMMDESEMQLEIDKSENRRDRNAKNEFEHLPDQLPISISKEYTSYVKIIRSRKYVVWAIAMSILMGMSIAIIVEGLSMSKIKSYIWLCVCLISTLIGLFLTNTFRVLIHVLVITFLNRKKYDEPIIACDPRLGMRMEHFGDEEFLAGILEMRSKPEYYPLKKSKINQIRSKMRNKALIYSLLRLSFILFIYFLVFFGTMNSWGKNEFHLTNHLTYMMKYANLDHRIIEETKHLGGLEDFESVKEYFKTGLIYMHSIKEWYNHKPLTFKGDKFPETGWFADFTFRMIGVIRIRQKLVLTEKCDDIDALKFTEKFGSVNCCPLLKKTTEDRQNYSVGWTEVSEGTVSDTESQWQYQDPQPMLTHMSRDGRYYSDGGYILTLGRTVETSSKILWKMDEANWFTHRAEVIFMDSCIYNVNINKLSVTTVSLELGRTHGIETSIRQLHLPIPSENFYMSIALYWVFIGCVSLCLICCTMFRVFECGYYFIYSFWNIVDLSITILFALSFTFGLANILLTKFSLDEKLNTGHESFSTYGWVNYHNKYHYKLIYILLLCLSTVKLFKLFKETLQVEPIVRTLRSVQYVLSVITLVSLVIIYFQFSVVDSFLGNNQMPSNRFPLVNKVGLRNYAQHHVLSHHRFVPYIFCQFCTLIISLFSILIVYYYGISKNSVFFPTHEIDFLSELRAWVKRRLGWKEQMRLRSGSNRQDLTNMGYFGNNEIIAGNRKLNKDRTKDYFYTNNYTTRSEMATVYKNMATKLDKIYDTLVTIGKINIDEELLV